MSIDLLLNVSFGIFAFLPQGWVFMILIMLLESFIMSELLCKSKLNKRITSIVFFSNFISGLFGIITTMIINGGWVLVVWFPWVSSHEINISSTHELIGFMVFYFVAFILSVLIELLINHFKLRKIYPAGKILKATILANIASYLVGSVALYSYSFSWLSQLWPFRIEAPIIVNKIHCAVVVLGAFCIYLIIKGLFGCGVWARESRTLQAGKSEFPATFLPETSHLSLRKP